MAHENDENRWGTIFMGPTADRESSIDKVTDRQQRDLWNRRTEAEYMERVRTKASLRVQVMLDQARTNAEAMRTSARQWTEKVRQEGEAIRAQAEQIRAEAEAIRTEAEGIRAAAYDEGYAIGVEQALLELDEHRQALDDTTASVLKTIEGQSATLFAYWRADLAELMRVSVETATSWILSEERAAILDALLQSALHQLEDKRRIVVRVNSLDCAAVTAVIATARARHPDLDHWDVQADDSIQSGGLLVESASGMVDSRFEVRREAVEQVLQHLILPRGAADEAAEAEVATVLEITGVTALAAEAEARAAEAQAQAAAQAEAEALAHEEAEAEARAHEEAEALAHQEAEAAALEQEPGASETAVAEQGETQEALQVLALEQNGLSLPEGQTDASVATTASGVSDGGVDSPDTEASVETSAADASATEAQTFTADDVASVREAEMLPDDDIPVLNITVGDADAAHDPAFDPEHVGARHGV